MYRGSAVCCPCCGGTFRKFITRYGDDELCPRCLSLRRHRALALFLPRRLSELGGEVTLLHFAPEEGLAATLRAVPNIVYIGADIAPRPTAVVNFDITAIPFAASSIDVVVCSHVLEHVPNDRLAMRELHRVLGPDRCMYSMHPVYDELPSTIEDPTITDPRERRRLFGQVDHVRKYGRDFVDRLRDAGFVVTVEDATADLAAERRAYYGLSDEERIFTCRTQKTGQVRPS